MGNRDVDASVVGVHPLGNQLLKPLVIEVEILGGLLGHGVISELQSGTRSAYLAHLHSVNDPSTDADSADFSWVISIAFRVKEKDDVSAWF